MFQLMFIFLGGKSMHLDELLARNGVIPEDSVFSSNEFLPQLIDILPPGGIYAHIAGMYWKITCASPPVPLTL